MKRLLGTVAIAGALVVVPMRGLACQCGNNDAPHALDKADVVFTGRVEAVVDRLTTARRAWLWTRSWFTDKAPFTDYDGYYAIYGFETMLLVKKTWKGQVPTEVRVVSGRGGGDCGYGFVPGRGYVVYAKRRPNGELEATDCTRVVPLDRAASDIEFLDSVGRR